MGANEGQTAGLAAGPWVVRIPGARFEIIGSDTDLSCIDLTGVDVSGNDLSDTDAALLGRGGTAVAFTNGLTVFGIPELIAYGPEITTREERPQLTGLLYLAAIHAIEASENGTPVGDGTVLDLDPDTTEQALAGAIIIEQPLSVRFTTEGDRLVVTLTRPQYRRPEECPPGLR